MASSPSSSSISAGIDIASLLVGSITSAGNAYNKYKAEKAQGEYQEEMYRLNAQIAEFMGELSISKGEREAQIAIDRGNKESELVLKRGYKESAIVKRAGKQVAGSQKVALAAQGIDIGSGSAADVIAETEAFSELDQTEIQKNARLDQLEIQKNARLDALTIKNNAWREAWGYKAQASIYNYQGKMDSMTANRKATTSLLTGGLDSLTYGIAGYGKYRELFPSSTGSKKENPKFNINDKGTYGDSGKGVLS